MLSMTANELTPCGAMFEILKKHAGVSHKELAVLILSERPLSDGRSPMSRAHDRAWVSRFVVHAPVGTIQPRYFRDYGVAARRVMDRLTSRDGGGMSSGRVLDLVCGETGEPMVRALSACHADVRLYGNALERLRDGEGYTVGERAEAALVLFVAAGCSANVYLAVDYTMDYVRNVLGGRPATPASMPMAPAAIDACVQASPRMLGLVRVEGDCIVSDPYWIEPSSEGAVVGALATGPCDVTDVAGDVSARHARIWCDEDGVWHLCDLASTNGTAVVHGGTGLAEQCEADVAVDINPGDEVRLGAGTVFVLLEGAPVLVG